MQYSLGISSFCEEISSLSHSILFPFLLLLFFVVVFVFVFVFCTDHLGRLSYLSLLFFGTLHSNGHIFPFLLCFSFSSFSQLVVKPPQTTILPFCNSFSWGWPWSLLPVLCHKPLSIVLQVLCLSDLIPWIYLSLPMYNNKGFYLGHTWMV